MFVGKKRKRSNSSSGNDVISVVKRIKRQTYLLISVENNGFSNGSVLLRLYNNLTKKIEVRSILWNKSFFVSVKNEGVVDFQILIKTKGVVNLLKSVILLQSFEFGVCNSRGVNNDTHKMYKIEVYPVNFIKVKKIFNGSKSNVEFYETNVQNSSRYMAENSLRFLQEVYFDSNEVIHKANEQLNSIPFKIVTKQDGNLIVKEFIMKADQLKEVIQSNNSGFSITHDFKNCILMFNSSNESSNVTMNSSTVHLVYVQDLLVNFLDMRGNRHENRMVISPLELSCLVSDTKIEGVSKMDIMSKIVSKYIPQALAVLQELPMTLSMLLKAYSTKILFDHFMLGARETNPAFKDELVFSNPRNLSSYSSQPLIKGYLEDPLLVVDGKNEVIVEFDYVSLYPSILLYMFQTIDKVKFLYESYKNLYDLKQNCPDENKKRGFKRLINSFYGAMAMKMASAQYYFEPSTSIAKEVCIRSRGLMNKTVDFFKKVDGIDVVYCNTDSVVLKGCLIEIKKLVYDKWNNHLLGEMYKYTKLKIGKVGKRFYLIRKNYRIWELLENEITPNKESNILFIGWKFNSVTISKVVRKLIKKGMSRLLLTCKSATQIKGEFYKVFNEILKAHEGEMCSNDYSEIVILGGNDLISNVKLDGFISGLTSVPLVKCTKLINNLSSRKLFIYDRSEQALKELGKMLPSNDVHSLEKQ